jgi:hypothetical protein
MSTDDVNGMIAANVAAMASVQQQVLQVCRAADAEYARLRAAYAGPETERLIQEIERHVVWLCRAADDANTAMSAAHRAALFGASRDA